MNSPNLRAIAATIINEVQNGKSLSDSITKHSALLSQTRDRAFVQAVCFGVCRFYPRLSAILKYLLEKPLKAKDADIQALLLIGLYQLNAMRIPHHAAVAETVNAVERLNKNWARSLINAVLRSYLRKNKELEALAFKKPEAYYAHPAWWITKIQKAWPAHWQAILLANNVEPPFALRVNLARCTREMYLQNNKNAFQQAHAIPETKGGIILDAIPVTALPGFSDGMVSVQDGAAQLAAEMLELAPNQNVLDACAAPGGKLTHILESEAHLQSCTAVEKDPARLELIKQNLIRENLQANCVCADVNKVHDWWDGKCFDRILLDAPCSASGVIRRHPDIRLLRKPGDIDKLKQAQSELLASLWPLLKPEGLLVYATCSIFPEENVAVVKRFLLEHDDAIEKPIPAAWGIACEVGRQILPGMHHMDGFYYARLKKKA